MNAKPKFALPLAAGALLWAVQAVSATESNLETTTLADDVVAIVNGEKISGQQFSIFYQDLLKRQRGQVKDPAQSQSVAFSEMMKLYALAQEAEKQGLADRPDVEDALLVQKKQFLARMAMLNFLNDFKVDEAEVQKLYEEKVAATPKKEYKARHILVGAEDDAKAVIKELEGGADFAELAKQKSTGPSGPRGGDLGWFAATQMVPPFAEATAAMEVGTYSKEPVKTQFGWHVIKLEDTREAEAPKLETLRAELENRIKQDALRNYVTGIAEAAKIEVNDKYAAKKEPEAGETKAE